MTEVNPWASTADLASLTNAAGLPTLRMANTRPVLVGAADEEGVIFGSVWGQDDEAQEDVPKWDALLRPGVAIERELYDMTPAPSGPLQLPEDAPYEEAVHANESALHAAAIDESLFSVTAPDPAPAEENVSYQEVYYEEEMYDNEAAELVVSAAENDGTHEVFDDHTIDQPPAAPVEFDTSEPVADDPVVASEVDAYEVPNAAAAVSVETKPVSPSKHASRIKKSDSIDDAIFGRSAPAPSVAAVAHSRVSAVAAVEVPAPATTVSPSRALVMSMPSAVLNRLVAADNEGEYTCSETELWECARHWPCKPSTVFQCVRERLIDINSTNSSGRTALANAARDGHEGVVLFLLQRKADVDKQANEGSTALMFACKYGYVRRTLLYTIVCFSNTK